MAMNDVCIEVKLGGLIYGCPFKQRLSDCPFQNLANETFEEKISLFENFDLEKKKKIVSHHIKCSKKREPNRIYRNSKLNYA